MNGRIHFGYAHARASRRTRRLAARGLAWAAHIPSRQHLIAARPGVHGHTRSELTVENKKARILSESGPLRTELGGSRLDAFLSRMQWVLDQIESAAMLLRPAGRDERIGRRARERRRTRSGSMRAVGVAGCHASGLQYSLAMCRPAKRAVQCGADCKESLWQRQSSISMTSGLVACAHVRAARRRCGTPARPPGASCTRRRRSRCRRRRSGSATPRRRPRSRTAPRAEGR